MRLYKEFFPYKTFSKKANFKDSSMKKKHLLLCTIATILGISAYFSLSSYQETKKQAKAARVKAPDVSIIGHIVMADGIGRQTAELAASIKDTFKVQIIANHKDLTDVSDDIKKILNKRYTQMGKVIICEESLWEPGLEIDKFFPTVTKDHQIRIAYSMLESSRIPQEWVMQLNLYFDAVVVPDPFLVEVYQKSGVTIPVFEIPLGLDLSNFLSEPLKQDLKFPMVFANLSSCIDRKNQVTLIRAFAKAFGNNENFVLKINSRGGDPKTIQEVSEEVLRSKCSNIHFSQICLKKDAYLKFFKSADCYVSLSKGEGFSIQPREAMSLGIPVIATDNTGQSTICQSGLVKAIASTILEPAYYFKMQFPSGYRYNCDVDSVAAALKDMYNNYFQYVSKAQEARNWASQYDYSNGTLKKQYQSLIYPKKVLLGSQNKITEEYLMTDSKELYEKYQKLINEWDTHGTELQKEKNQQGFSIKKFISKL